VAPYLTVAPSDPDCESEGAYPAVDVGSGDVYVGYEFNGFTNLFGRGRCLRTPTREVLTHVRASCLTLPSASCGPDRRVDPAIVSLDAAFIPGYNRFPANDFPRIAVSPAAGTVSMVWNDARLHPLGDILMKSFGLGTLNAAGSAVRLNRDVGGMHFLPAVRTASATGRLAVTWYQRNAPDTTLTSVKGAVGIDPGAISGPPPNVTITTGPSDWNAVSSDIVPNFGDYTDNYVDATAAPPFVGQTLFVAWSDGRLGVPQPFEQYWTVP